MEDAKSSEEKWGNGHAVQDCCANFEAGVVNSGDGESTTCDMDGANSIDIAVREDTRAAVAAPDVEGWEEQDSKDGDCYDVEAFWED